jgi:hypothetical protein
VTGILTGNPRAIDQRACSSFTTTSGLVCACSERRLLGPRLVYLIFRHVRLTKSSAGRRTLALEGGYFETIKKSVLTQ